MKPNPTPVVASGLIRPVVKVVRGQATTDGGGVRLTRVLGTQALPMLDPFLMLDEFRSDEPGDYIAGFPDHPHRGFETVTYMLAGRMRHGDNKGHAGVLGPGSVQWMTAGRGIVHSEMPEQEDGLLWGFQLWVNLPAKDKMVPAKYQEFAAEAIPAVTLDQGGTVKVIAGHFGETEGPVKPAATEAVYLDVALPAGADVTLDLPVGHAVMVYVYQGTAQVGPIDGARTLERGELAVLGDGPAVRLAGAGSEAGVLVIGGKALNEPIARYGPFVMTTQEQLQEAFRDYQLGRL